MGTSLSFSRPSCVLLALPSLSPPSVPSLTLCGATALAPARPLKLAAPPLLHPLRPHRAPPRASSAASAAAATLGRARGRERGPRRSARRGARRGGAPHWRGGGASGGGGGRARRGRPRGVLARQGASTPSLLSSEARECLDAVQKGLTSSARPSPTQLPHALKGVLEGLPPTFEAQEALVHALRAVRDGGLGGEGASAEGMDVDGCVPSLSSLSHRVERRADACTSSTLQRHLIVLVALADVRLARRRPVPARAPLVRLGHEPRPARRRERAPAGHGASFRSSRTLCPSALSR